MVPPKRVPTGFQITWRIHAASTPKSTAGTVDVRIETVAGAPSLRRMLMKAPPSEPGEVTDEEMSEIRDSAHEVPDE